jgi:hypothetical protein
VNTIIAKSSELTDQNVQALAIKALRGQMPESKARWLIAAALIQEGVPDQVAQYTPALNQQNRDDLAARLRNLIETKAIQETDGGYDLRRAASGESACGWARALAKAGVLSALRDIRLHTNRTLEVNPILDFSEEGIRVSPAERAMHYAGFEDDYDSAANLARDEEIQAIEDDFSEAASGRRSSGRLRIVADALISTFGIPAAVRPDEFLDREFVREATASTFIMAEDGSGEQEINIDAARDSATALLAFIMKKESDQQKAIDQRLINLWGDYSVEDLSLLVLKPARVAQALALAAVSAAPRPSRDTVALTLRTMRLADEDGTVSGFKAFTKRLLDSWIATEAEAVNEFDSRSDRGAEAAMAAASLRMTAALNWPAVVEEAIARPGQPFGSSMAEVNAFITSIVAAVSR